MTSPLSNRRFRRYYAAQSASMLGDAVQFTAISFAVLEVDGSAGGLALVLGIGTLAMVTTLLFSGVLADRLPRLRVMIAADVVRLLSQSALAVLLLTDRATLTSLVVLHAVHAIGTGCFTPARTALLPQLLAPAELVRGNGLLVGAQHVFGIMGLAGGGLLVAATSPGTAIAIDALTFLVSALLLFGIGRLPLPPSEEDPQRFLRELAVGWREVRIRRWLWSVVAGAALFHMLFDGPLQVVGPVVMRATYSGALAWGLLGAALSVGMVVGALVLAPSPRIRRPMLTSLLLFLLAAAMPMLLLEAAPVGVLLVWWGLSGLGFGMFDTLWHSAIQQLVPADRIARVSAWDWMGSFAAMPVGVILAGFATEQLGREVTLRSMAVGAVLVTLGLIASPDVRALDGELRRESDATPSTTLEQV